MIKDAASDLTRGSLYNKILIFAVPLIATNLLQVLFNMADLAVVGQFSGVETAVGSIGSTTMLVHLFTGFLIGTGGGVNAIVAKYFGANDEEGVSNTVHTAAIFSLAMGVGAYVLSLVVALPILNLIKTKEDLIDGAILYIRIYFIGMPALAVYNFGNGVLSSVGDTRRPLIFLTISGVCNILLNILFVTVFDMDVAGVAIASVISQYVSAVLIVGALIKSKDVYGLKLKKLRITLKSLGEINKIGVPAGIQAAMFQVANLFIQSGVNSFSTELVSGNSAALNAEAFTYSIMTAFYTACSTFVGQNYGAGKKKRILKTYFICSLYSFIVATVLGAVGMAVFGRYFLMIFTDNPAYIDAGMVRMRIMGFSYCWSVFLDCTVAASRGLGKSIWPMFFVVMGSCVFRIIYIYTVFKAFHTPEVLYLLYLISWLLTAVAEIIYFAVIYKKLTSDFDNEED